MKQKLLACISGGETSGMMGYLLKQQYSHTYEIIYTFQNTGQEDERTLIFVDKIDKYFGLNIVWLEAVVNPDKRKGITHKIVNFETACRDGSVFESHIAKYGIPSASSPHCTRDLKAACTKHFCKTIGWKNYIKALGFRYDEPKRVNLIKAEKAKQWYPLYQHRIIKEHVKAFWAKQPFQLGLLEFEGNCKMCFKKSKRKLLTQILEHPEYVDWIIEMESKYPINKNTGAQNRFFRGNESIFDLLAESKLPFKKWVEPVYNNHPDFDIELDEQDSCAESCEPFPLDDSIWKI